MNELTRSSFVFGSIKLKGFHVFLSEIVLLSQPVGMKGAESVFVMVILVGAFGGMFIHIHVGITELTVARIYTSPILSSVLLYLFRFSPSP